MNIRQIKLTLTVDLLDQKASRKPIFSARKSMEKFKGEVGKYLGLLEKGRTKLSDVIERRSFALQYEYCTLDLELVTNPINQTQFLQGFDVRAN